MKDDAIVLLVDDDSNDVDLLRLAFEAVNPPCRLIAVSSGVEAIEYLTASGPFADRRQFPEPDVMLLDLRMPMINGFQVLSWMQEQPPSTMPPVIVLSHSRLISDRQMALDLGAWEVWHKPVDFENTAALVRRLEAFCASAKTKNSKQAAAVS